MKKQRFIEVDFPIEWLDRLALREGNSKRPVYRMHKWWARRLGSVFRALLITLIAEADTSPEQIWQRFSDKWQTQDAPLILDPFMGGGTTLFESLRLGARVIGSDINPVAWFLTKKEIEPVGLDELKSAYGRLEARVGEQIQSWYSTTCPKNHKADVMYAFWVKQIPCSHCKSVFDLWPNYWIARWPKIWTLICPCCGVFFEESPGTKIATCSNCGYDFAPAAGNSGRGKATCSYCGQQKSHLGAVQRLGGPLPVRLFGIEGYCSTCDCRFLKPADDSDLALVQSATKKWKQRCDSALFPCQEIPTEGRSDPRPVNHGYTHFHHLFLPRQLLTLSTLLEGILAEEDINLQEHLLLAFSDALDANNLFCKYEIDYHKISLLFGLHAYHPIERPTENNVWGTRYGRGSFSAAFNKVLRGKQYALAPYERGFSRGSRIVTKHPGVGVLSKDITSLLQTDGQAHVRCGDSADLSEIPDKSIDAVVTDPPYFDNVMYSELADFFYVWLRLGLKERYPWFEPEHSRREAELVQNEKEGKSAADFTTGLTRVWRESRRVLKDRGLLVFTFHHNDPSAWASMGDSLIQAGFVVTAAPFVRSEGKSGFHSSKGNIRYDAIFVCRKGESVLPSAESWAAMIPQALEKASRWLERTAALDLPLNPGDLLTALMGEGIVALLSSRKPAESPISLEQALLLLAQQVPELGKQLQKEEAIPTQLRLFAEEKSTYTTANQQSEFS